MTSFRTMVSIALFSMAVCGNAYGQTSESKPYRDLLRECGQEWKASDARKAVPKGEGTAKWQEFRAECVKRKGWNGPTRRNRTATTERTA